MKVVTIYSNLLQLVKSSSVCSCSNSKKMFNTSLIVFHYPSEILELVL